MTVSAWLQEGGRARTVGGDVRSCRVVCERGAGAGGASRLPRDDRSSARGVPAAQLRGGEHAVRARARAVPERACAAWHGHGGVRAAPLRREREPAGGGAGVERASAGG